MKINQLIREKRKELSLTQEQLAERLGVSAPAVNKWEKGSSYPDITLLPPLARLLKTDLNTLMAFNEDLTEQEIESFVEALDKTAREQSYEAAFQLAMDKIHEYPNCDKLIFYAIIYLEGALFLCGVAEDEAYRAVFEPFYRRLAENENPEIRDTALSMLISYARSRGDFPAAEELINALPFSAVNREEQLAILYHQQKKYEQAGKIWEQRLLKAATEIQTALINIMEIALLDGRRDEAKALADIYEGSVRRLSLPEWMRYNAHLQLALESRDRDECIALLQKMLPAMKREWRPEDTPLYRHLENGSSAVISARVADSLWEEVKSREEYDFIRACPEFTELKERLDE